MTKNVTVILFVLLMVAIIVSMDVLFFRHKFLERLVANIGVVLVFIALYFLVIK